VQIFHKENGFLIFLNVKEENFTLQMSESLINHSKKSENHSKESETPSKRVKFPHFQGTMTRDHSKKTGLKGS
jgi:hypothetical protein